MTFDELKALDHAHTLQTYGRFDVDVDHGQGATLWDLAGRTYIDFTSGIGVCSVGYGNEKWARAIYDQALTLGHISNLFSSSATRARRPTRGFSSWPANTATTSTAPAAAPS